MRPLPLVQWVLARQLCVVLHDRYISVGSNASVAIATLLVVSDRGAVLFSLAVDSVWRRKIWSNTLEGVARWLGCGNWRSVAGFFRCCHTVKSGGGLLLSSRPNMGDTRRGRTGTIWSASPSVADMVAGDHRLDGFGSNHLVGSFFQLGNYISRLCRTIPCARNGCGFGSSWDIMGSAKSIEYCSGTTYRCLELFVISLALASVGVGRGTLRHAVGVGETLALHRSRSIICSHVQVC